MKNSLCVLLLVAACGDTNDNVQPDSGVDAHVPVPRAVAVAGDFGSPGVGTISKLTVDGLTIEQNLVPGAALGDPVLRTYGGKLYVVNRFGSNNITVLDAKTLALEEQIRPAKNSNPQDVAIVGEKLYIPALGTAGVVVMKRGSPTPTTIDLSALDTVGGNDGMPECVSAYAVGTKVYVACGVLDSFAAVEPGKVAVIDTATDTMVASVSMNYANPYGFFVATPADSTYVGDLLIATAPSMTSYATGCIQRIRPARSQRRRAGSPTPSSAGS